MKRTNLFKLAADRKSAEVLLYDEIGAYYDTGVTAKDFIEQLAALGQVDVIVLRINSPGGIVTDAFAIYNALKNHGAKVIVQIDGLAASSASVVAMAGDEITIAANGFVMIHRPWNVAIGDSGELRKSADILDKLEEKIVDSYAGRVSVKRPEIVQMMADETWLNAEEALAAGFVDSIGAEQTAAAMAFDLSRFRHPPEALSVRPPRGEIVRLQEAADAAREVAVRLRLLDIDDDAA